MDMGDIRNSLYNGGALSWDGLDVGWIKDVEFSPELDLERLKTSGTGGPLKLRGKKAKEYNCSMKAGLFEVARPDVMAMMLGGGSDPVQIGGAPITKTEQPFTFAAYQGGGVQAVILDGPTISTGIDAPVVQSSDLVTTYTEDDDYIVDYDKGVIYRNPGGAIGGGAAVKVTYKYTPSDGYQIPLGANFALARKQLVFSHIEDDAILDGAAQAVETRITFWQAEPDGKPNFKFTDGSFVMPDITWDSIEDATGHPTQPFGKIEFLKVA